MNPPTSAATVLPVLDTHDEDAVQTGSAGACMPEHLAIIMDGNGRWAQQRGLPRVEGHRRGVEALRRAVRDIGERGIRHLTLFAFSSENWKRPPAEVRDLMMLLRVFIERDLAELKSNGVNVQVIGERDSLTPDIRKLLERAEHVTRDCNKLYLTIAFNYGARNEIVRATQSLARQVAQGTLDPEHITQELFSQALDTASVPDPDLIIRTSGEMRLSNFLLWQAAYAEFVFTPTLWPDFTASTLDHALHSFQHRERRFGGRHDAKVAATG